MSRAWLLVALVSGCSDLLGIPTVERDFDAAADDAPKAEPDACMPKSCQDRNATCGTIEDGCGGTKPCNSCTPPSTCHMTESDGTGNMCMCTPLTSCSEGGYECGMPPDGCFGSLNCPSCADSSDACTNSICTPAGMVGILAGSYQMGCNSAVDSSCDPDESPQHTVTLGTFRIDITEVSEAAYDMCVSAGTCTAPAGPYTPASTPTLPVQGVTWDQASAYCAWAGKRLPTEAEWERAARGTDGRLYPWGASAPTCSRVDYSACSQGAIAVTSDPSGASPAGALNMSGNEWEWVADYYDPSYYASSPTANPQGPTTPGDRVIRGGSYSSVTTDLRTSNREHAQASNNAATHGFRCAK
jgi:formylglycine-generating enzyme required for sulfatase activity